MAQAHSQAPHVLVVDDDTDIRRTIADILESEGYSVALAANGRDALDRIEEHEPALILLDLQMPVMTGWEVLSHLRAHSIRIPVVFMTAGFRAQTEAERHQAEGHLRKPFEMDELLDLVARFTGRASPP
jgi:CheY-like chemotaxis protein